jgi:hypothetical protein
LVKRRFPLTLVLFLLPPPVSLEPNRKDCTTDDDRSSDGKKLRDAGHQQLLQRDQGERVGHALMSAVELCRFLKRSVRVDGTQSKRGEPANIPQAKPSFS